MPQKASSLNLEVLTKELFTQLRDSLIWKWDERFSMVQTEFSVDSMQSVFTTLKPHLKEVWDADSINLAPEHIQSYCNQFGRFHSDQIFSSTDSNCDELIYCAIWPWSDGEMISIRLAPYSKMMSDDEKDDLLLQFRHWFGL